MARAYFNYTRKYLHDLMGVKRLPSSIPEHVWVQVYSSYYDLEHVRTAQVVANVCLDSEGGVTYWQARHWINNLTNGEGPDVCVWSRNRKVAFRTAEALVRKALRKTPE